jgi:hypothetical protein
MLLLITQASAAPLGSFSETRQAMKSDTAKISLNDFVVKLIKG